jgi:hypothetical protein
LAKTEDTKPAPENFPRVRCKKRELLIDFSAKNGKT